MMRLRRASAIAVPFLLASAATAHAECAWVLWEKATYATEAARLTHRTGDAPYVAWTRPEILATQSACSAALATLWHARQRIDESLANLIEKTTAEPRRVTTLWKAGGYTTWEFECLPDTIDPREPKGGSR